MGDGLEGGFDEPAQPANKLAAPATAKNTTRKIPARRGKRRKLWLLISKLPVGSLIVRQTIPKGYIVHENIGRFYTPELLNRGPDLRFNACVVTGISGALV